MNRRSALVLAIVLGPQSGRAFGQRQVIEAIGISAYFAPHRASHLAPGTRLGVLHRGEIAYLVLGRDIVGRLPAGRVASSARVAMLFQGDDGRTRMYVQLE